MGAEKVARRNECPSLASTAGRGDVFGMHGEVESRFECEPAIPVDRRMMPLLEPTRYSPPSRASELSVERCSASFACEMVRAYHSRLPNVQSGPWKLAFAAHFRFTCFGAALWHNTSARGLPQTWLELRRLVVAPDAPHCTASRMLGQMVRWIRRELPEYERVISYQDCDVHTGTIYRAAGWEPAYFSKPRNRDRSKPRVGTRRDYRSDANGLAAAGAGKVRWELAL